MLFLQLEELPVDACRRRAINGPDIVSFFGIKTLGGEHLGHTLPEPLFHVKILGLNKDDDRSLQLKLVWRQTH